VLVLHCDQRHECCISDLISTSDSVIHSLLFCQRSQLLGYSKMGLYCDCVYGVKLSIKRKNSLDGRTWQNLSIFDIKHRIL